MTKKNNIFIVGAGDAALKLLILAHRIERKSQESIS